MKKLFTFKVLALVICLFDSLGLAAIDTSSTMVTVGDTTMSLSLITVRRLPVLWVETVDGEEPTCEYLYAPSGCIGATINATKVPGRVVMYLRQDGVDNIVYDSGDYVKDVSGMTIKIRGNTSAFASKKPYKLKLQKKRDLLLRGNDSIYKDKEWLLLKDDYLLYTTAQKVAEQVGIMWNPANRFVNLIINGSYRGIYLLCESVKRNPDCRLNVDKNSGYIFECDPYWWNEPTYVYSSLNPIFNYTFKYPDGDEITPEQLAYMQQTVSTYEASVPNGNYDEYIDVTSFAAWCLIHDIECTKDGGGANRFYLKYDSTAESKIVMPLVWDFDMSERSLTGWSNCHVDLFMPLFNNSNRAFVNEYLRLWCKVRETLVDDVTNKLIEFRNSYDGYGVRVSFTIDNLVWNNNLGFDRYITSHCNWQKNRFDWLDENIMAMHVPNDVDIDGVVDIDDVTALVDMLLGVGDQMITGDIDGDGEVTIDDVTALIDILLT